jgi:hypothetical protein
MCTLASPVRVPDDQRADSGGGPGVVPVKRRLAAASVVKS